MVLETAFGQVGWRVKSSNVSAFVTRTGGMLGPVQFDLGDRVVEPFSIAPWADEPGVQPPILAALRGDFFCLPFGHSPDTYLGEDHPLHGETANHDWEYDSASGSTIDLLVETRTRPSKVCKTVRCGDLAVYQRHAVLGMKGPMCFGQHAMIRFKTEGLLSLSDYEWGQVFPGSFEEPASGGYTSLEPGAGFTSIEAVPLATGGEADLSTYPARAGYEDLVQTASKLEEPFAWSCVVFPEEGYLYFQLKDRRVLPSTVLWFSNGGRHYAPWSGRHRGVLGIEEVNAYFHLGLRGSVAPNPFQRRGISTYVDCDPAVPLDVRTILGVAAVPLSFGKVTAIARTSTGIVFIDGAGTRVDRNLDLAFLGVP